MQTSRRVGFSKLVRIRVDKIVRSEFIFHCSGNSRTRKSRIGSSEGARNARIYTTWFYIPRRHERGKNVISRVAPKGCADRFCLLESSKDTRNVDTMKPILRDSNSFSDERLDSEIIDTCVRA